jgi:hypothetical protein
LHEKGSVNIDGERIVVMGSIKSSGANGENVAETESKKETKMFNQVKRMFDLPDVIFEKIAKALKEKEGVKIENVLDQIHKERES